LAVINGTSTPDTLNGTTSADSITGGAGNDTINGGAGNDTITGGTGYDEVTGGAGADVFVFAPGDSLATRPHDAIMDFEVGTDRLQLDGGATISSNFNDPAGQWIGYRSAGGTENWVNLRGVQNATAAQLTGTTTTTPPPPPSTTPTAGNDNLTGTANADVLNALAGNDTVDGGAGNDTITGGTGYDEVTGGAGADVFVFAPGDSLATRPHDAIMDFEVGTDRLQLDGGATIPPTSTTRRANGSATGAPAAPRIGSTPGVQNATAAQLTGTTTTTPPPPPSTTPTAGNDTLTGTANADTINALAGNDTVDGGAGNDTITGGTGYDEVTGGAGADVFVFAPGDSLATRPHDAIMDFEVGTDRLQLDGGATISSNFNDPAGQWIGYRSAGGTENWVQLRGVQNATAAQLTGTATTTPPPPPLTTPTAGNDTLTGTANADVINALAGNDTVDGGAGNDTITGGTGYDEVTGGAGADVFVFAPGDSLATRPHDAIMDFEVGTDRLQLDGGATISSNFNDPAGQWIGYRSAGGTENWVQLRGVQNATAAQLTGTATTTPPPPPLTTPTAGNDTLTGTANADVINALAGNDTVDGGAGNDTITGGTGYDEVTGGAGADVFVFAPGDSLATRPHDAIMDFEVGTDRLQLDGGATISSNFNDPAGQWIGYRSAGGTENWVQLRGVQNATAAQLTGTATTTPPPPPLTTPTAGNDTLTGTANADVINALAGNDTVDGGAGNDTITGGTGYDEVTGGAGADVFVFAPGDSLATRPHDAIMDFEVGTDRLQLDGGATISSNFNDPAGQWIGYRSAGGTENWVQLRGVQNATAAQLTGTATTTPPPSSGEFGPQVWGDEFNGTSLGRSNWPVIFGGDQLYWNGAFRWDSRMVSVGNGSLNIGLRNSRTASGRRAASWRRHNPPGGHPASPSPTARWRSGPRRARRWTGLAPASCSGPRATTTGRRRWTSSRRRMGGACSPTTGQARTARIPTKRRSSIWTTASGTSTALSGRQTA
jgi:Ca2+-binding RTX toxin-like protein